LPVTRQGSYPCRPTSLISVKATRFAYQLSIPKSLFQFFCKYRSRASNDADIIELLGLVRKSITVGVLNAKNKFGKAFFENSQVGKFGIVCFQ